ncbi:MAG TPA: two-component regulator propeller domain-containing protein [Ferruginibacter sp.]|nr:two-component regulator propeller domain-containing protein [Ferruginibacter sp.]HRO17510.1 two-component regulator propeller domain-containing protein [Ferruginibacter sp.]HRQ21048.1 two-component regulator propeller domain-containing protein [Ferruginibacter sp.]
MRLLFIAISVFFVFVCNNGIAQTNNEFVQIGVNNGLSQNSVHDIFQDKKGFLWIATADGFNRYDGIRFKVYKHRYGDTSSTNIPADYIQSGIQEDQHENLWLIAGDHLVQFNKKNNRFHTVYNLRSNPLFTFSTNQCFLIPVGEEMWVFGNGHTILKIHILSKKAQLMKLPEGVREVFKEGNGSRLFVNTPEGCSELIPQTMQLKPTGIKDSVNSISGMGDYGLAYISHQTIKLYHTPTRTTRELKTRYDKTVAKDAQLVSITSWNNNLLFVVVSGKGLLKYDLKQDKTSFFSSIPGDPGSLSINYIRRIFIDRSDNLWLATEGGGLSKMDLKHRKFNSYPVGVFNMQNPANLMIKSIFAQGSTIYAGTFAKGLYMIDTVTLEARIKEYPRNGSSNGTGPITVLYQDTRKRLWMNTGNVIGYTNMQTGQWIASDTLPDSNDNVYSIYEVTPDTFMIGCLKRVYRMVVLPGGQVKVDDARVYQHKSIQGLIQSIVPNGKGEWYIGIVEDGFRRCKITGNTLEITDSGMMKTGVRHFYPDAANGWVWIASDNGLIAYDESKRKFILLDESDGLSNSHVYAILPESNHAIWISTNKGINRIEFEKHPKNMLAIRSVQVFTQKNGLQSNEFNSGAWFAYNRSQMIFGGVTGINWFNTQQIISNHHTPEVVLTGVKVNEQPIQRDTAVQYLTSLRLPHQQNALSVSFAALEFTNPEVNQYAYRMVGADDDWVQGSHEVRYAGLSPGTYRLWVKASNNDGVWGEPKQLLKIIIEPPFWLTWWFKLGAVISILSLTAMGVRYIIRKRVREKMRAMEMQQALNEERLRISRDMHDEMGTGLTKISLLSEVARQSGNVAAGEKTLGMLQDITGTARGLTQKMGEIIWMLNPVNDTLDSLAAYLKEYVFLTTDGLHLDVMTDFPEQIPSVKLSHEKRRQLLLVTREALHNALKHSKATQLTFAMDVQPNGFQFLISDNGTGFESTEKKPVNGKHNGLKNMQWRMHQINGFFTVESETNKGTTIIYGLQND